MYTGRPDRRQAVQRLAKRRAQLVHIDVGLGQQRPRTVPPPDPSNAVSRCTGSMNWWSRPTAMLWASASAIWNFACQSVHPHGNLRLVLYCT